MLPDERQLHSSHTPVRVTVTGLHQFFDISPDALLVIDPAGTILMVNEQTEALFGFARSELVSQQFETLLAERFRVAHITYREHFFSALRTCQTDAGLQLSGKRKDGTEFPVDINLRPLLIDEAFHVIAAVHDLTEQKRMIEALATRTHELESSVEELATRSRELEGSNEALATRSRQLEGSNETLATRSRELEGSNKELVTRSRELEGSNEDLAIRTNELEGSVEELATRSRELERSNKELATRSRDLEHATNTAVYRLASIVEYSGDAILGKTLNGMINSWNSGAEKLFGYTADEVIGKSIALLIPPDRQKELPEILARIAAGETVQHLETTRVRKDGTHIEVSVTTSPIRDDQGRIIAASIIAHDISEQKRMVEELTLLNSALEEAIRARSQFHSTMSHELRTPLASIIGFSQILLDSAEKDNLSQRHRSNLERILKNGQHLLTLINDVLDLAKIEAGHMGIDSARVDVKELLTDVVEETQSIALARNLVLRVVVEEGIGTLESDPLKLRQILLNLVANALKFTEQGEVIVSATREFLPGRQTDRIAIAVKDSGIGISPEIQKHIFEAFYQVDGSHTRKVGGTGLGLSIVSQLAALLGGTIEVKSTAGQGSTFTLMLPITAAHEHIEQEAPRLHSVYQEGVFSLLPPSEELAPALLSELFAISAQGEAPGGQSNLVLVVDDNPDAIALVKEALRDTPYTVVAVLDSSKVIGLVQELHPCAITLDVMMPDLNGWQILHQLKVNPASASIPVVMITVLSEQSTGYVLGADDYLIKPFKSDVLLNTLHRLVKTQQVSSQTGQRETRQV